MRRGRKKKAVGRTKPSVDLRAVRKAFDRFGFPSYSGKIHIKQFGNIMRYLGKNPSDLQVREMLRTSLKERRARGTTSAKELQFMSPEDFLDLYRSFEDDITLEEMQLAFKIFPAEDIRSKFMDSLRYSPAEFETFIMKRFYSEETAKRTYENVAKV